MPTIIQNLKRIRFLHLIETAFNRIVPAWIFRFSVGHVLELDLDRLSDLDPEIPMDGWALKTVVEATLRNRLRQFTGNSVPVETTKDDLGFSVAKQDEPAKLLGGVWVAGDSFGEVDLGFQIQLEPGQAWLYCAFVDKPARGLGVYKRLLSYVGHEVKKGGFQRLLVMVQPWNKASINAHRQFASALIGRIIVVRIFRFSFVFRTGAISKKATLTTQQQANPVLLTMD